MDTNAMLAGLHPTMQAALAPALQATAQLRRAHYVSALKTHDWEFEFSDDHRVFLSGNAERAKLMIERAEVDADGRLWNLHAPAGHKIRGAQ